MVYLFCTLICLTLGESLNTNSGLLANDDRFIIYVSALTGEAELQEAIDRVSFEGLEIHFSELEFNPDKSMKSLTVSLTLKCDQKKYQIESELSFQEHPLGVIYIGDDCQHGMMTREIAGMVVEDFFFKSGKPESIYYTWEGGLDTLRAHAKK